MTAVRTRVLYIDDDPGLCRLVQKDLERQGYIVETVTDGASGVARIAQGGIDVVALDHYMPNQDGLETLADIRDLAEPPPVIYVTAMQEGRIAVAALKAGAVDYVPKDVQGEFLTLLQRSIEAALEGVMLRRAKEAAEAESLRSWQLTQSVIDTIRDPLVVLEEDMMIVTASKAFLTIFGIAEAETQGRRLSELGQRQWDVPALRYLMEKVLPENKPIESFEIEDDFPGLGRRVFSLNARRVFRPGNHSHRVLLVFEDITERKQAADALEAAHREAQTANAAKSRFLAAASHDLRQPLQTLTLLQGLLAKTVQGEMARKLVVRFEESLGVMSDMLDTLLNINQIEAGAIRPEIVNFPINGLLDRLRDEFTLHAETRNLAFRVVSCGVSIRCDPRLLEQMVRNLLSNAFKYTEKGKVLLGCRRHHDTLSIEILDTGIGIPEREFQAIFEEYHQLDNVARERSRGLGLGLPIVQRLGKLLGHRVSVRSHLGKGSVFAIDVMLAGSGEAPQIDHDRHDIKDGKVGGAGAVLVVEDDAEVRDLIELVLEGEGYDVVTAPDGIAALELVARGAIRPDLMLADYNLPNGLNGLQLTARLREELHSDIPVVILTGDISTVALRDIAGQNCAQLIKPVKWKELTQAIQRLLAMPAVIPASRTPHPPEPANAVP